MSEDNGLSSHTLNACGELRDSMPEWWVEPRITAADALRFQIGGDADAQPFHTKPTTLCAVGSAMPSKR